MWVDVDPRSKLFASFCLTTMAIIVKDNLAALLLLGFCLAALVAFQVKISAPARALRRLFPAICAVAILQLLLIRSGAPLLRLSGVTVFTDRGLNAAFHMAVRIGVIASCGTVLYSIGFSDFLLAMKAMRVPYELSFMAAIGAKFVPLLAEQMTDSLMSARLRGADISRMWPVARIKLYTRVLMPATVTALTRAETISWALELKGFDPGKPRTYWRRLEMDLTDWLVLPISAVATAAFLLLNYGK